MLKNIGTLFEKKREILDKAQDTNSQIKDSIKTFLKEKFGESLKGYSLSINYSSRENNLTITADSKIIANEISLQLGDLNDKLKRDGIKLNRILVR